jgi:hypothetical protein
MGACGAALAVDGELAAKSSFRRPGRVTQMAQISIGHDPAHSFGHRLDRGTVMSASFKSNARFL